jgi:Transposase DDE domain group 1
MDDPMLPLPGLSPVLGKSVVARFDGGQLSSDAGVLVLREIEQRLRVAERLAACIGDPRAQNQIVHSLAALIRFRMLMIASGYEDGNDATALRSDPAFKLAEGVLPSGPDLASQSTISRLELEADVRAEGRGVRPGAGSPPIEAASGPQGQAPARLAASARQSLHASTKFDGKQNTVRLSAWSRNRFPSPLVQFARSGMLHIAQNDIGRFPPPRLHDGQRIKTGHHHILGGADAHGMAGKCAKDGRIEASPAGGPLDDPPDGRGCQRPLVRPVEVKRPEQRTRLQLSGLEPAGEEGRGFRREIGKAPIARGVGF